MRKKIIYHLLLLSLIILMSPGQSCTRNNGDIGPIFGRWSLKSVQCVNAPQLEWEGDLFLAFQNDVVQMTQTFNQNYSEATFGKYRLYDNTLFLEFNDADRPVNPAFGLPSEARLQVLELSDRKLILEYNPSQDASVTYTFQKW